MDVEKRLLINTLENGKVSWDKILANKPVTYIRKTPYHTELSRNQGNSLYKKDKHDATTHVEIFSKYNQSIAFAPLDSEELALAYGNRSAFLLHIKRYEDCLIDIERALQITSSNVLTIKLLCRKVDCLKKLGLRTYQNALETARLCCSKIVNMKLKQSLNKFVDLADACQLNTDEIVHEKNCDKKDQIQTILNQKDVTKVQESISISYSPSSGRHLVATKDFEPGEIIFVEKPYSTHLNPLKYHTNCNYCLKVCWTGIACDHCNWALFCNDECKEKAWIEFHDVECAAVPYIREFDYEYMEFFLICLRTMIIGIKENGSVEKLRDELEKLDSGSGFRGFVKNRNLIYNTIKSVYVLKSDGLTEKRLQYFAVHAVLYLFALIKHSSMFQGKKFSTVQDMINDENLLFVGVLLLKLFIIKEKNACALFFSRYECEKLHDPVKCRSKKCCLLGSSLAMYCGFLNHSCYPNTMRCLTEDHKLLVYATRPIKKNEQIFDSYGIYFYDTKKAARQEYMRKAFESLCNCEACLEDWPTVDEISRKRRVMHKVERQILRDCKSLFMDIENIRNSTFDLKSIQKLTQVIKKAHEHLKQPSELMCKLTESLDKVMEKVYGLQPEVSFQQCERLKN